MEISNKKIFEMYQYAMRRKEDGEELAGLVYGFADDFTDGFSHEEEGTFKKVVQAILNDEEVTLAEQKYYVVLPHFPVGKNILSRDQIFATPFLSGTEEVNKQLFLTIQQEFTKKEIDRYFPQFKQFSVKIEDYEGE